MILEHGHDEELKLAVHAGVGTLAAVCAIYNLCAFLYRDELEWHLAVNAIIYGALTAYETKQIQHHLSASAA